MSWLRVGDNSWTNPIVSRARALLRACTARVLERDVITCELLGFVIGCASLAASHETDYVIGYGTALTISPVRADRLLDLAVKAGYMVKLRKLVNGDEAYKIVDDPNFLHMILKAEREWTAQRKADNANPALTVPARLRDGDACRYCAVIVNWNDRKGGRGGTYDHRRPGQPSTTLDVFVVSCFTCNRTRGDNPDADQLLPLLPAPARPYYSDRTLTFLAENGRRPATADDPCDPAPSRAARPATPQPAGQRDRSDTSDAPAVGDRSADSADRGSPESGFTGSGRDGPGRVPTGSRSEPTKSADRSRRSRRRKPRSPNKPIGDIPS